MDILQQLSQCYLCSGLDKEELAAVHAIASIRKINKGAILFMEGDPAAGFYVLLTGRVKVYKSSPEGKEVTIHQISPGQLFAEAAIFRGDQYPANCIAIEDATIAYFPKDLFIRLITNSPQISLKIIGSLSGFLREFNRQVEELTLMEISARLSSFILRESQKSKKDEILLDVPKTELAKRLGTISETFSRNLRKLKELGIIEVDGKRITIIDRARLISIAEGEKI
jgi:CRP/FNR family transcriptional regulator, dissimilatory nitrate respiration regulator